MQAFFLNFFHSEITSRAELLVALQDIHVSVNEIGLGLFLVPDGICVWLVLQPGAELFHSYTLNQDFNQPAHAIWSMALLAPKRPGRCSAECRFGEATVMPGALVDTE